MWHLNAKNLTVGVFIVIGGMVGPGSSYADQMLVGPKDAARGIDGLVIPDVGTYNVKFVNGAYTTVYPNPTTPTFMDDLPGAEAASVALTKALNMLNVTNLTKTTNKNGSFALVPYSIDGQLVYSTYTYYAKNANEKKWYLGPVVDPFDKKKTYPLKTVADFGNYDAFDYTVFTEVLPPPNPVGIPTPDLGAGMPGLIFAGGGMLAWWRRKRKAQAVAA